jgi:hypothetical protein
MIEKLWQLIKPPKNTTSELDPPVSLLWTIFVSDMNLRVTSKLMFPYKEDLVRFDFEVAPEDEYMCEFLTRAMIKPTV